MTEAGTRIAAGGRYLVLFEEDATEEGARTMTSVAGIKTTREADIDLMAAGDAGAVGDTDGVLWDDLGIAVVSADPDQIAALSEAVVARGPIVIVEREQVVYAISTPTAEPARKPTDDKFTWGLEAVRAPDSPATGKGVRIAVLDTGFDVEHPDFADRVVVTKSFIDGEDIRDVHGHGTHVIGTACGPRKPGQGPGYGIAYESEIYVGKVLDNTGAGTDGGILAGIAWAVKNGCSVVSMSLGAAALPGQPHSVTFERAAQRAMDKGTLIVAAAGNESKRSEGVIAPVGHPANCPSIMAVGAIDVRLAVADFSCGTVDVNGAIDVVAPGVDVYSSWPMPERSNTISGTSMATPHVSGIAALSAETHKANAWALWARLTQSSVRLPLLSTDVGAGLVQAP